MMIGAEPPAAVQPVPAAAPSPMAVVRRESHSEVLANRDTPLPLVRAGQSENALLRQAIFLNVTITVLRPEAGAGDDILRWSHRPYLQRQFCFTSITGQFSCATGTTEEIAGESVGESPLPPGTDAQPTESNPLAEAARLSTATGLSARAATLFDEDRRLRFDPMLSAAGVSIQRSARPPAVRR